MSIKYEASKLHPEKCADFNSTDKSFIDSWVEQLFKEWKKKQTKQEEKNDVLLSM